MRFGSVCSGIEAASVAWQELGWVPAWLAEVDVAASAVLAHRLGATAPRFPLEGTEAQITRIAWRDAVTNWGDMTLLPALVASGDAEAPDVLCGGTPCQGFSIAGLRGGLSDPRGQLTLSFVELANAIDDKRAERDELPCAVFWENVPGVRSDSGNAFGHFLAGLVGEDDPIEPGPRPAEGRSSTHWTWQKKTREHVPKWPRAGVVAGPRRTVGWRHLDAQYFDLAQRRERVFVVGSAREGFDPAAVLFEFEGVRRDSAPSRGEGEDVAGTLAARTDGGGFPGTDEACAGYIQACTDEPQRSSVIAMAHGQGGAEIGEDRCPTLTCNHEAPIVTTALSVALRGRDGGGDKPHVLCIHGTQDPIIGEDLAHALGRNSGQENAVCITGNVTHALTAEGFDASEDGTGRGQPIVPVAFVQNTRDEVRFMGGDGQIVGALAADTGAKQQCYIAEPTMSVRRLMPVECERLQGFPDGWTDVPVGNRSAADGPRYKQLGNSWAVPCVNWLGRRLAAHLADLDRGDSESRRGHPVDLHLWLLAA